MQEINLLVEQKDGSIETNFEEIKVALAAGLEEYGGGRLPPIKRMRRKNIWET